MGVAQLTRPPREALDRRDVVGGQQKRRLGRELPADLPEAGARGVGILADAAIVPVRTWSRLTAASPHISADPSSVRRSAPRCPGDGL